MRTRSHGRRTIPFITSASPNLIDAGGPYFLITVNGSGQTFREEKEAGREASAGIGLISARRADRREGAWRDRRVTGVIPFATEEDLRSIFHVRNPSLTYTGL